MNFHVGQKVVCVKDSYYWHSILDHRRPISSPIKRGAQYTVRAIGKRDDMAVIWLEEIAWEPAIPRGCKCFNYEYDMPMATYRFRPVHTTDISIFTAMLAPKPAKELARKTDHH